MSKKIRLITTMLLLSLLMGIAVVFASASEELNIPDNQLIPDAAENVFYADFENDVNSAIYADGSFVDLSYNERANKTVFGSLKGDRYMSLVFNPNYDSSLAKLDMAYSIPFLADGGDFALTENNYLVFDIDISTDRYLWNGKTYTVSEYEADLDGVKSSGEATPAYPIGAEIGLKGEKSNKAANIFYEIASDSQGVYIDYSSQQNLKIPTGDKAYLSNEVGVVDHLTIVFCVDDNARNGVKVHFYLNGNKFSYLEPKVARKNVTLSSFDVKMDKALAVQDSYSLCIDNVAFNVYANGYASSEGTNLSNFNFSGTDPISNCSDIVYNSNYLMPGGDFVSCGGKKVGSAALANILLAGLKDGERIVASGISIEGFTPPEGVEGFEVLCDGGAEFSLSDAAKEKFVSIAADGNVINYYSRSVVIELKWYEDPVNGESLGSEYLVVGSTPTASDIILPEGYVDFETMKYYGILDWYWCLDGVIDDETTYPEYQLGELTEEEFNIAKIVGGGVIVAYPVLDDGKSLEYVIVDYDGEIYLADGETPETFTDIANAASSVLTAPAGATLVVFGDGETVVEIGNIVVPEGGALGVDLNGQKVEAIDSALFTVSNNAILNVYSSVEGAEVYADDAVVYIPESCVTAMVNFGIIGEEAAEDYFDFYGASLVKTDVCETVDENRMIYAIVAGGKHVTTGAALFDIQMNNVLVYLADANVLAVDDEENEAEGVIFSDAGYANAILIESTAIGDFFGLYEEPAYVVFLGNNVIANSNMLDASFADSPFEEVLVAMNNSQNNVVSVGDVTGVIDFATFDPEVPVPEGVSLVKWMMPDGETEFAASEYWYAGSTPVQPEYDEEDIPNKLLENGWFDIQYKGFANVNGEPVVLDTEETVFVPVETLVANLTGVKMNVSLYSNLAVNVYVPAPAEDGVIVFTQDGVHLDMLYDGITGFALSASGNIETENLVTITYNDATYYGIRAYVATYDLDGEVKCYAKFVVKEYDLNGNGSIEDNEKNILLTQDLTTSFMSYVVALLSDEQYGCGTEEAKLVFDLLEYKRECYKLNNELSDNNVPELELYNAILEGHGEGCACKTDINSLEFTKEEQKVTQESYAELSTVIGGISYIMNADAPSLAMLVPKSAADVSLVISFNGINGEAIELIEKSAVLMLDGDGEAVVVTVGEVEYYVYCYDLGMLCNAASVMTITLATTDSVVTGKYCLAEYIEMNPNVSAARALYAAAKSSYNYRTE